MKAPEFHSNSKDEIGRLFWGDVVEAADELAVTDVTGIHQPGDAEIDNLHLPSAKTTMLAGLISPWIMLGWREWAYSKSPQICLTQLIFCSIVIVFVASIDFRLWPSRYSITTYGLPSKSQIINDDNVGVANVGGELGFVVETLQQIALRGRSSHHLDR